MNLRSSFNLHVSKHYVKSWKKPEAVREIFQNWRDKCYSLYPPEDLKLVPLVNNKPIDQPTIASSHPVENPCLSFGMLHRQEIVAGIHFQDNQLCFWNPGSFSMRCFILGGSDMEKHSTSSEKILGKFGEGMKLAALALCREGGTLTIGTGKSYFSFDIQEDPEFDNEPCLFMTRSNRTADPHCSVWSQIGPMVAVTLNGVTEEEWKSLLYRYLELTPEDFVDCTSESVKETGSLLLSNEFGKRVYVKGVWVCDDPYGRTFPYGINLVDCELDRDRMMFKHETTLVKKFSSILGNVLNSHLDGSLRTQKAYKSTWKPYLNNMVRYTTPLIERCTTQFLSESVTPETASAFFQEFRKIEESEKAQPNNYLDRDNLYHLGLQLSNIYRQVDFHLLKCLKKAPEYRNPKQFVKEIQRQECYFPKPEEQELANALGSGFKFFDCETDLKIILTLDHIKYVPRILLEKTLQYINAHPEQSPLRALFHVSCEESYQNVKV